MDLYQALGAHIRHHRRALDMSQDTLAAKVGLPPDIVGKIERGTTTSSFETVEKIAAALVLPPLALFGVGEAEGEGGDRAKLIKHIIALLAGMDDAQLARTAKMLEALVGA